MSRRGFSRLLLLASLLGLAPLPALAQGFSGAGSTFAHPIIARWAQGFTTWQGEGGTFVGADGGLDYEPVGSLAGVMRVIQGAVDFGATDVSLPPEDLDRHGLAQFPLVTGGVAVVTNIAGIPSGRLRLDGPVLARIYLGEITRWSDPAIAALNPGTALPEAAIAVLHRQDGSGTTYHFASYLAASSPTWGSRVGVNTELSWPVGAGVRGNAALAEQVRATANAIGYVEASQAARLNLPVALIGNRAGAFVAPDAASLRAAAATARWDAARHFHQPVAAADAAAAYPITATVYALMPRQPASRGRSRQALDFFRLALGEQGAATAAALGYVPLPEPVARQVAEYWRASIRGAR